MTLVIKLALHFYVPVVRSSEQELRVAIATGRPCNVYLKGRTADDYGSTRVCGVTIHPSGFSHAVIIACTGTDWIDRIPIHDITFVHMHEQPAVFAA